MARVFVKLNHPTDPRWLAGFDLPPVVIDNAAVWAGTYGRLLVVEPPTTVAAVYRLSEDGERWRRDPEPAEVAAEVEDAHG